jgi:hypothetical protein
VSLKLKSTYPVSYDGSPLRWLRRRRPQPLPAISYIEALQMRPVKNPRAESSLSEKGEIIIKIPLPRPKGIWRVLPVPEYRSFILDRIGSHIWDMIDGEKNVKEISDSLVSKFRLTEEEAGLSLLKYLQMLANRGLIFMKPAEEKAPKT